MVEILVYIIILIILAVMVMDYLPKGKKKEIKNQEIEEIKEEVADVNEYDTLTESFEESMSKYRKILHQEFKVKEKIHKDKYDSKKDELIYLEEEVKKLRKFAEEIKLQEKIYKLYEWSRFKNGPIKLLDNLIVDIQKFKGENNSNGFRINFNDKTFTILEKSTSHTSYIDDSFYSVEDISLFNLNDELIFRFEVEYEYDDYSIRHDTMRDIDVFKNGDWVLDVSLLYENIMKLEEINKLPSEYDTSDIDKIRKNFDINET